MKHYTNTTKNIESMAIITGFAVFLIMSSSLAVYALEDIYGPKGGSVELPGQKIEQPVETVLWTHNGDKAAELDESEKSSEYFGVFKLGTELNKETFSLRISLLKSDFEGIYTLRLNHNDLKSFKLTLLENVTEPNIIHQCDTNSCTLICNGTNSQQTKCKWTNDKGDWKSGIAQLVVEKSESSDRIYICNCSNPVSWNSSEISKIKLFPSQVTTISSISVGVIVPLLIIVVIVVVCLRKHKQGTFSGRDTERQTTDQQVELSGFKSKGTEDVTPNATTNGNANSESAVNGEDAKDPEIKPLTTNDTQTV